MITTARSLFILFISCLVILSTSNVSADRSRGELSFLEGFTLVVLDTEDITSLHKARNLIQSHGGHIAIMSPPSLLMGWVPYELRDELVGKAGIRDMYFSEVAVDAVPTRTYAREMVQFFNNAVNGGVALDREIAKASLASSSFPELTGDALDPPEIDSEDYVKNLEANGVSLRELEGRGQLLTAPSASTFGNSDFMTGTASLSLFFMESDGSGADPDVYTWTPEDMQSYIDFVTTGLAWWTSQAAINFGCSVSFLVNYYSGADPRCQQWVEPILHPANTHEDIWVKEIMSNFGYNSGSRFTRVTAFNTWQISYYQTDRSFSAFIPYNPAPAPTSFSDGKTAYAYLGGPYIVQLFRLQGSTTDSVFAHETGHIFFACDEYAGGCGSCVATCGNGVANGNCETCNPDTRDCMMKFNTYHLCSFTKGQIGWGINNPCSPPPPPPLPAPTVSVSYPPSGLQGFSLTVTVGGTNFFPGAKVEFGPDVFVNTTTLVGAESLVVDVTILNDAALGLVDVTVRNKDNQNATINNAFEILPTLRHYYSPTGGDVFPYLTPADAATTLDDAIDAAFDGDTLYVPTMTFNNFSYFIPKGVLLYGAWNSTFTTRDLQTGKTVLNLDGNVTINPGSLGAGLDGFEIQGGTGAQNVTPFMGYFGGAIRILDATAIIANCDISMNSVGGEFDYGVGGAIFAHNSDIDFRNNLITQNTATDGGAIYMLNCSGFMGGNTITGNSVAPSTQTTIEVGGGLVMIDCSNVTMSCNTIGSNTGAQYGGGMYIENSTSVVVSGDTISGHSVTGTGGGVDLSKVEITFEDVTLSLNSAGNNGGGVNAADTCDVTMNHCSLLWNSSGAGGGGIAAVSGIANIDHNLFVGNSASSFGGAIGTSFLVSGSIVGNTIDRSTSGFGAGIASGDDPIEIVNNIVVNSTGSGIICLGNGQISVSHNLSWNNSGGEYSGCGPGTGAISQDPLFADTSEVDYHLTLNSPAIDSGKPGVMYDDPDGSPGDMGRYGSHSFLMDQPSYPKNLSANVVAGNVFLDWDSNPEADIDSYAVYCDTISGFTPSAANLVAMVTGTQSSTTLGAPGDSTFYRISAVDTSGYASGYSDESTLSPPSGTGLSPVSYSYKLQQNTPNPFNPVTRIAFEVPGRTNVLLEVYDVEGRLIRTLVDENRGAGVYSVEWDGRNSGGTQVSSGIYFYRIRAGSFVRTKKMVLLK